MTTLRALAAVAALATSPAPAQTEAEAIASNFGLAVDLCLQHTRDRNPVDAFRAAGFTVTPSDEGTFNIDLVDARKKKLVWEAVGTGRVSESALEELEVRVNEGVAKYFAKYPFTAGSGVPVTADK